MGTDDLFKKRYKERKKRKHEFKTPKVNSFLIVTEGKRTEPFYFKGLQKKILEEIGGRVDVVEIPKIDIEGEGCSTGKLITVTDEIVKKANIMYQNVQIVFDKDDFEYSDAALHRDVWNEKLDALFKRYNLGEGCYRKNYENIFELLNIYDGVKIAIKHAKRRMADYDKGDSIPSKYDPGTMVHVLVEELMDYLKK